jgi:hemoglobin-like flavoprotein
MTLDQRNRIRASFDLIRDISGPVALLFYGKLFELDGSARRLFHNDLGQQAEKLMNMLGSVVESLDHFDSMTGRLAELGRQHAGYGVRAEQYETLEKALLWALAQALGPDFDSETRAAWKSAIAAINSAMKAGAAS